MAKSNYAVAIVDLSNPISPAVKVTNCTNMSDATALFQASVKAVMQTKFKPYYDGIKPKAGYAHSVTQTDYRFVMTHGSTSSLLYHVSIVSADWADGSAPSSGGASAPASSAGAASASSAPSSSPKSAGPGPVGKPGPKGPASGNITKVIVGGKEIEIEQSVLAAAFGAALAGMGVSGDDDEGTSEDDD